MKEIELYTDGACSGNPGPGGYGFVLKYKEHIKEKSQGYASTTNNRMELMAIIKGLESLKESCNVKVYSDSKYIVDAINKKWVYKWEKNNWLRSNNKPALNSDLWKRLLELVEKHNVEFNWVKGHAGHPENERCDQLATSAIKETPLIERDTV
ncbi:ribonuclease HI [Proteinivorax tanatarense]|uniref:Ribonuclease H n=1 Tax=Proteinivorax tanatarense TaxID=1260629 RepID=A0AAU7VHN5_9FIRM